MLTPSTLTPMDGGQSATFGYSLGTVLIAANGTTSTTFIAGFANAFALAIPSTWTTATISFLVSLDGTNFAELYETSAAGLYSTPSFANGIAYTFVLPTFFAFLPIFQLVSSEAQTDAVTIGILCRNLN